MSWMVACVSSIPDHRPQGGEGLVHTIFWSDQS